MKLSVILSARDTDYGGKFIERFYEALSTNIQILDLSFIDYEIIVVDYNPLKEKYLYQNEILKPLLTNNKIKNIIVNNSVVLKEGLYADTFYEYFAKNVGVRQSSGDFLFLTNADIVLSPDLVNEIKQEFTSPYKDEYFYRCRYRASIEQGSGCIAFIPEDITYFQSISLDLHRPEKSDNCVCGYYAGDATMFTRKVMFNFAKGYNEELPQHRTEACQFHMDSEILWNCYLRGLKLKFLNNPYFHIEHLPGYSKRDNYYYRELYDNKSDWGCINYAIQQINPNTFIIK